MATTTNFGWTTPNDTDLVKDGAAAIRTLGQSIDTSMMDLKGGTTGQVLAKNSNTDMDFVWSADAAGMTNPMTTTGDTIYSSSGSTPARRAIGTTGQVLTVSGGLPTWATPSSPVENFSLIGTGTTTSTSSVTVSGISGINTIMILFKGISSGTGSTSFSIRPNSDTGANYDYYGSLNIPGASYAAGNFDIFTSTADDRIYVAQISTNAGSKFSGYMIINGCNSAGKKVFNFATGSDISGGNSNRAYVGGGVWNNTDAITSINLTSVGGNFDAGSFAVLGSA
jgi:hypothetical protein